MGRELTPEELAEFAASTMDQLKQNVPLDQSLAPARNVAAVDDTPAERISIADAKLREESANQAKQNTLWRRILFWGVSSIVASVVLAEIVVIVIYMSVEQPPNPFVLSTWFAASVAQVIGLLLVITRHLFPSETEKTK